MKYVIAPFACMVFVIAALISIPWIVVSLGLMIMGDLDEHITVMEHSPVFLLLELVDP